MLEFKHKGKISIEKIVDKMCHAPADIYQVKDRGYIREGYMADLVLIDLNKPQTIAQENLLYKCKWSPFEGTRFSSSIISTIVNGELVFNHGKIIEKNCSQALEFER